MSNPIEITFSRAVKYESRLKLALESESGAGKTLTALILASRIAKYRGGRIALADSEHKTALLYADLIDFDHFAMPDHRIETYLAVMDTAERQKYSVLIMDSTSHVWNGKGGALQEVDETAERDRTSRGARNTFGAWRVTRPKLNTLVDRINEIDIDLICTFRQKKKTQQTTQADGSTKIESVGVEMIGPNDIEYEFTILADLIKGSNELVVTKTRCPRLKGQVYHALSTVEPINLDTEPATATHGMIDTAMDWLKGTPVPKQAPKATGATSPTRAYLELHDRFCKVGEGDLWDDLMEKYGLSWHFTGMQMEDPAIAERSRDVFKVLKALVAAKELERKINGEPTTQQADPPATQSPASSPAAPAKPEPEPAPAPPTAPAEPEPQPTPILVTPPNTLTIGDFAKTDLDTLFKTAKTIRPKGYNRAAFLDELQTYRGTREDFIATIMNNGESAGGQA